MTFVLSACFVGVCCFFSLRLAPCVLLVVHVVVFLLFSSVCVCVLFLFVFVFVIVVFFFSFFLLGSPRY